MKPIQLANAFSLNMIPTHPATIETRRMNAQEVREALAAGEWHSAVGHQSTADLFSNILEIGVPSCRESITLERGDRVIVGQYRGPRLEEGAIELPEGATIAWFFVLIR